MIKLLKFNFIKVDEIGILLMNKRIKIKNDKQKNKE